MFLVPLPGSWRFLILEFTWAFETSFLFLKKNLKKNCLVFTSPNMSMNYFGDIMIDYMFFLAHCYYCLDKWELLDIVYESVNRETRALLEQ